MWQSQLSLNKSEVGFVGLGSNWETENKTVNGDNFFKKLGCGLDEVAIARTRVDVG